MVLLAVSANHVLAVKHPFHHTAVVGAAAPGMPPQVRNCLLHLLHVYLFAFFQQLQGITQRLMDGLEDFPEQDGFLVFRVFHMFLVYVCSKCFFKAT